MLRTNKYLAVIALVLLFSACSQDDGDPSYEDKPSSGGGPSYEADPIPLTINTWADGSITYANNSAVWYSFYVDSGTTYYVWWNDRFQGNSTKTLDIKVSAYYSDGTSIFIGQDFGWTNPQQFTASTSGTVKIKVEPYSGGNTGTFAVAYSTINIRSGTETDPIPLTVNTWADGLITANTDNSAVWYSFFIYYTGTYYVWWNDSDAGNNTKTLDIKVSVYYDDGTSIFIGQDSGWTGPQQFTASTSGMVKIKVEPYSGGNTGTFAVAYSTVNIRPETSEGTETDSIPLSVNTWADGSITSTANNSAVWYSFNVTSGTTYYIWWNDTAAGSSKTLDIKVSAYHSDGTSLFMGIDSGWGNPQSFTASASGTVKIKVAPYSSGNTGTFAIAYNTSNIRPGTSGWTEPDPIPLSENIWADGVIAFNNSAVWYSFDVVSRTTYYVWWNDSDAGNNTKTLDIKVNVYYNDGTSIFTDIDSGWTTMRQFTASTSSMVYIKVEPYFGDSTGTFAVAYSTSSTRPEIPFSASAITINIKQIIDDAPIIEDITISRSDPYSLTRTVSVTASDYDSAGSIKWEVAGVGIYAGRTVTGSGGSFTLDANNIMYNSPGGHALILTVMKGGQQYRRAIPFTIVP